MAEIQTDFEEVKRFWLSESEEALNVTDHLMEKGDFSYSLFFGHLAIEKILKAAYVAKHKEHAPLLHNLVRLAKIAGLELDENSTDALIRITSYNIESRYPDIKAAFRKKCTSEFTIKEMKIIKEYHKWIKSQLQ
jgi:HEPN domain-containing protein